MRTHGSGRTALVTLSGDAGDWARRHPASDVVARVPKDELGPRALFRTLVALRAMSIDTMAFVTLSVRWQHRQIALFLVGLLAGARRVVIVDPFESLAVTRRRVVLRELPRALAEAVVAPLVFLADRLALDAFDLLFRVMPPAPRRRGVMRATDWLYVLQVPASVRLESGTASHVRGVLDALDDAGCRVRVVSHGKLPDLAPSPLRTERERAPSRSFNLWPRLNERWNNLRCLPLVWRECGSARPQVVYQRHARHAWAGVVAARLRGIPLVLEFNESEVRAGVGWNGLRRISAVRRAETFCLHHATVVSCVSEELAAMAVAATAVPRSSRGGRMLVNPNGVDVATFGSPGTEVAGRRLRERFGLGGRTVVCFVSTFMPYHGAEVLAAAVELLAAEPAIHVLFIGDGARRPNVEAMLGGALAAGRVTFAGRVAFAELPPYLAASDVCVAPYVAVPADAEFVNSPIKILEYMAAGRATVASDLGPIRRMLGAGGGMLVPPGDAGALADALRLLANDPALRQALGAEARREARRHTWRMHVERVVEALDTSGSAPLAQ
jgi:glycosyltransferase involved in cell wall biosynthesis